MYRSILNDFDQPPRRSADRTDACRSEGGGRRGRLGEKRRPAGLGSRGPQRTAQLFLFLFESFGKFIDLRQ